MSKNSGIFGQIIRNFYKSATLILCNLLHVGLGGGSVAAASCGLKSVSVEIDAFFQMAAIGRMIKFAEGQSMLHFENDKNYGAVRGGCLYNGPISDEDKRLDSKFKVQTITPRYEDAR